MNSESGGEGRIEKGNDKEVVILWLTERGIATLPFIIWVPRFRIQVRLALDKLTASSTGTKSGTASRGDVDAFLMNRDGILQTRLNIFLRLLQTESGVCLVLFEIVNLGV